MLTPCEVAVKTVSPAIRALLAKNLLIQRGLKQTKVAEILGITQSAVSKYSKNVRGTTVQIDGNPEVHAVVSQMANLLVTQPTQQTEVMRLFCQACKIIRSNGLMCPLCWQNQNPKLDNCDFCNSDGC